MIDKSSYGSVGLVYVICAALVFVLVKFVHIPLIVWPSIALILWFAVWQTFFFRVPKRNTVGTDKAVASVADGRVIIVQKAVEQEYLKRECIQISVYMNFFDVHSNFWPANGEVTYYKYHPGAHMFAFEPKASLKNEHTCICMKVNGKDVFFKQIAGGFARRISFYGKAGDKVNAGDQCGIIKFGSRIDMYLPLDAEILVKEGDYARASETLLAKL